MEKNNTLSMIALILSIMIWGASFIATRIAVLSLSPVMIGFLRCAFAALILAVITVLRKKKYHVEKSDLRNILLSAIFGITIYYAAENYGIALTSASSAAAITAVYPIFTVLIGRIFFHDFISLRQYAGIFLAVGGIVFLSAGAGGGGQKGQWIGNVLLIINGLNWGFYNYLVQSVSQKTDINSMTLLQSFTASLGFLLLLPFDQPLVIGPITPALIAAMVFLSAGCSVAAYYLYNYGLRGVSAAAAAACLNLLPVFGIFFSWALLHEPISLRQILGAAVVILGVILSSRETEAV
ncbi:MAG: DMT family transporter [Solobacterium sp.]|nr:DMT family transporter [Solobacterium sp.]